MALNTPRRLHTNRPGLAQSQLHTASSPALNLSASTTMARKASLNALTGGDGQDIEVGDLVDVPGGMHGVVKFVGSVHGKKGIFAGVELAREYAARGKNDGDVDGTQYFTTSIPGAGIFLPLARAVKRTSGSSFPLTPNAPPYPDFSASTTNAPNAFSPPTPSLPKFSQSIGPGSRAPSPQFKKTRTPQARPESPLRKPPTLTPGRSPSVGASPFSKSAIGAPRFASPGPTRGGMGKPRTPGPSRPYSRTNSRLGQHTAIDEDSESVGVASNSGEPISAFHSRGGRPKSSNSQAEEEVALLRQKLEERDRQLKEQAASLAEMEASLQELQSLIPTDGELQSPRDGPEDADVAHLRALLREKNEKITMLTAEFDAHRADFRSTIDTLEMASTETERVYQKREEDLLAEIRELQEQAEDVSSVAQQLKQLEELVQELEEGLEDARRGEAEARGEVEFLRGEVERGRSELKQEREKAQAALEQAKVAGASDGREVEQRDDEIRGLKAIIHSLSSGPEIGSPGVNGASTGHGVGADAEELAKLKARLEALEREKEELHGMIERKSYREEELEREVARLRRELEASSGMVPQRDSLLSQQTATQDKRSSERNSKDTIMGWRSPNASPNAQRTNPPSTLAPPRSRAHTHTLEPTLESDTASSADGSSLWCEICETGGHDILNCTAMGGRADAQQQQQQQQIDTSVGHQHHQEDDEEDSDTAALGHKLNNLSLSPSEDARAHPAPLAPFHRRKKSAHSFEGGGGGGGHTHEAATAVEEEEQEEQEEDEPHATTAASAPPPPPQPSAPTPLPNPYDSGLVPGKGEAQADANKWCALCERDGHDATNCPFEDAF